MDPEVERAVRAAIARAREAAARGPSRVSLPHTEYGLAAYYVIAPAEASSNLARYDGVKYGLRAPGARDLIDMYSKTRGGGLRRRGQAPASCSGTYALSAGYYDAYYGKAQKVRTLVRRDFEQAFERVDLIVAPTTPSVAFKMGEKEDPLADVPERRLHDPREPGGPPRRLGAGAASPQTGLPIGLQLIGRAFDEATLLRAAHAYEQATTWHDAEAGAR